MPRKFFQRVEVRLDKWEKGFPVGAIRQGLNLLPSNRLSPCKSFPVLFPALAGPISLLPLKLL
jgi:hypothetical protein